MGHALVQSLRAAGIDVQGPEGRGATGADADIVLLAVPDAAIAAAGELIVPGRWVGHLSGATTLDPLHGHRAFSIHPLMTVTPATRSFAGTPAAIAGEAGSLAVAEQLVQVLGMDGFVVADADRPAYHAAAPIASNYVVTLLGLAEELARTAGVDRDALVPLVRAAVDNWAADGAEAALTGPIARGDEDVVARQRAAVVERLPDAESVFDALADVTRRLAGRGSERRVGHDGPD